MPSAEAVRAEVETAARVATLRRMPAADASLVIVNYRTAEMTGRCLALSADAAGDLELERVVIDNASGDGSVTALRERHPEATIVEQADNRGFGAGVNAGFAATSAPFVVLLNPDTEPRPGAIARLVEHLRTHPRAGVAAPLLLHPGGAPQRSAHRTFPTLWTLFVDFCVPLGYALALRPDAHPHELSERRTADGGAVAHVNGSALAIRRDAYEQAGGFDEGFFMYLEETEWQQRARRRGWSVDVVPEAEVVHVRRAGAGMAEITDRYLPSIYRYMELQGRSARSVDAVLALGSSLSRLTLAALARLRPSRRGEYLDLLAFHRAVWAHVKARRRR